VSVLDAFPRLKDSPSPELKVHVCLPPPIRSARPGAWVPHVHLVDLCGVTDWSHAVRRCRLFRRQMPAHGLAIVIDRKANMSMLSEVLTAHFPCVMFENESILEGLTTAYQNIGRHDRSIVDWLAGFEIPESLAEKCAHLLTTSARGVDAAATQLGISDRSLRHCLVRRGLPATGEWLRQGHALRTAAQIRTDHPNFTSTAIVIGAGYGDLSTFVTYTSDAWQLGSRDLKWVIGWEPLLYRWLTRRMCQHRTKI
jgi:hypothetical protein